MFFYYTCKWFVKETYSNITVSHLLVCFSKVRSKIIFAIPKCRECNFVNHRPRPIFKQVYTTFAGYLYPMPSMTFASRLFLQGWTVLWTGQYNGQTVKLIVCLLCCPVFKTVHPSTLYKPMLYTLSLRDLSYCKTYLTVKRSWVLTTNK